jgi:hypothetical protein
MTFAGVCLPRITRACGVAAVMSLMILASGCAGGGPASGNGGQASRAATEPAAPIGPGGHLGPLAGRYLAIAVPANHRLDSEVDGFTDHERDDLAAAKSDLRAEATTERWFDQRLAEMVRLPAR